MSLRCRKLEQIRMALEKTKDGIHRRVWSTPDQIVNLRGFRMHYFTQARPCAFILPRSPFELCEQGVWLCASCGLLAFPNRLQPSPPQASRTPPFTSSEAMRQQFELPFVSLNTFTVAFRETCPASRARSSTLGVLFCEAQQRSPQQSHTPHCLPRKLR